MRSDDLDSVLELYTEDDFRQLVVTIETTPAFFGGLGELEDHGELGRNAAKTCLKVEMLRVEELRPRTLCLLPLAWE